VASSEDLIRQALEQLQLKQHAEPTRERASSEDLIRQALEQLQLKQHAEPTRERALAITNVETGLVWLQEGERRERHAEIEEPYPPLPERRP
jgi:hypothetical protein